jgi:hypothetical protein
MADFFNEKNWTDSGTLALLGAGAGMLDPRGGMAAGFSGAMEGMRAGQQIQQRRLLAQKQAEKLERDMETKRQFANIMSKYGGDKPNLSAARTELLATGNPDLFGYAESLGKALPKVKTTERVLQDGQAYNRPIFDTGEYGALSDLPAAEKLMQINQGSQIGLANPYTGQIQSAVGVGMTPGEGARLSQAERQFGATHGLAQDNATLKAQELMLKLDPTYQAKKAADIAVAKEDAMTKYKAASELPQSLGTLAESLNLSDELKNHPALESMVGGLPTRTLGQAKAMYGGNKEADFAAKLEQSQGKQFLSAIQAMKGFGALTDVEGNKMQSAAAAMTTAQSPADFKRAQDDYQNALLSGARKVAGKLGMKETDILDMLSKERNVLKGGTGNTGRTIGTSGGWGGGNTPQQGDNSGFSVRRLD